MPTKHSQQSYGKQKRNDQNTEKNLSRDARFEVKKKKTEMNGNK